MTSATAVTLLRRVSTGATAIAPTASGIFGSQAGWVLGIVGAGTALAADLVAAGQDPIAAIHRIRDTHPLLAQVETEWTERLARRWRQLAVLPPDSSEDIYAELEREARS